MAAEAQEPLDALADIEVDEPQVTETPKVAKGKVYLATTKGGKVLQAYRCPRMSHWKVECATGGVVPTELDGQWTRMDLLKLAVDTYMNK